MKGLWKALSIAAAVVAAVYLIRRILVGKYGGSGQTEDVLTSEMVDEMTYNEGGGEDE